MDDNKAYPEHGHKDDDPFYHFLGQKKGILVLGRYLDTWMKLRLEEPPLLLQLGSPALDTVAIIMK